ncbi:MAG TPA: hypothetical protein VIK11_06310 [Tepidiformaceae bacterium]|jgi:hypothetical protein
MNWQDDPQLLDEMALQSVRGGLVRSAIIWTPPFVASAAGFVFFLWDLITAGGRGGVLLVGFLAVLTVLFGYQSIQSFLDLRGEPLETEAVVTRRWHRNDSIIVRTHYVRLGSRLILRGGAVALHDIREGQRVAVRYFPHSAVIITIKPVAPPTGGPPSLPLV